MGQILLCKQRAAMQARMRTGGRARAATRTNACVKPSHQLPTGSRGRARGSKRVRAACAVICARVALCARGAVFNCVCAECCRMRTPLDTRYKAPIAAHIAHSGSGLCMATLHCSGTGFPASCALSNLSTACADHEPMCRLLFRARQGCRNGKAAALQRSSVVH